MSDLLEHIPYYGIDRGRRGGRVSWNGLLAKKRECECVRAACCMRGAHMMSDTAIIRTIADSDL